MSIQQRVVLTSALFVACALVPVSSFAQLSFEALPIAQSGSGIGIIAHGDFNNDGREDLAVSNYYTTPTTGTVITGYQLYLSNGDGSYQTPGVTLPASVDAVGDFNGDGNLDFASFHSGTLFVYLGNGNGTFQGPQTVTTVTPFFLVAADMNHDGKTDLVAFSNGNPSTLQVWISNGNGSFSKGQTISLPNEAAIQGSNMITGDFDGDSKPDIALIRPAGNPSSTTVQVWYGDGAGHLGSPYTTTDPKKLNDENAFAADLNSDGRSDIIATLNTYSDGQIVNHPNLAVFTGNANRTMSYSEIVTSECPVNILVDDFNGDGVNDLLFEELTCTDPNLSTYMYVKLAKGSNSFDQKHLIEEDLYPPSGMFAVRTGLGTRPDVVFSATDARTFGQLAELINTTAGNFPGCGPSGFAEGVTVCEPGASVPSPVTFSVGAAGPTPMRTASVWADGKKVAEQLTHAFSTYSFLDASVPLAAGSHRITVIATGWDGSQLQKTVALTVAGGTSCAAPTTPGVNLCQPVGGSTVSSPVVVQATAKVTGTIVSTQLWVDGVKTYNAAGSTTLTTSVSLAAGTHRFAVIATNTTGTKWEQAVTATVQ
jgi:hypothetical protein